MSVQLLDKTRKINKLSCYESPKVNDFVAGPNSAGSFYVPSYYTLL